MKSTVLKYGTISGLITAAIMLTSSLIEKKNGFETTPAIIGYIGIVLIFIPLYWGVRSFRDSQGNGSITFWKALNIGVSIVVVSGILYAVARLMIYYWMTPDYPEQYSAFIVKQIKTSGKDLKDTVLAKQQMVDLKEVTKNPFIFGAYTFTQPLLLGLTMSLLCAALLRKKGSVSSLPVELKDVNQN